MASRRLDISSLLCDDDAPSTHHHPPPPQEPATPPVSQPRNSRHPEHIYMEQLLHSPPTRHRTYSDYPELEVDPPRPFAPTNVHSRTSDYRQPRPSSSSRSSHSPLVSYNYPSIASPSVSPSVLPPPGSFPSPVVPSQQQRLTLSPYNPHQSPVLHRPMSSHAHSLPNTLPPFQSPVQSQPRHPSLPHRSRSNTSPAVNLYPLPSSHLLPSPRHVPQSTSPPTSVGNKLPYIGLEALVHAATEERRRLSGGSSSESGRPPSPIEIKHHSHHVEHHPPQPYPHHPVPRQERSTEDTPPTQKRRASNSPLQEYKHRAPVFSSSLPHPPHHHTHERERSMVDNHQILLSPVQDTNRAVISLYPQPPESSRRSQDQEQLMEQQLQLQRQRQHHEQLLLQEKHHHQRARERLMAHPDGPPAPLVQLSTPMQIEIPAHPYPYPHPQPTSRKSDPGQPHRVISPVHDLVQHSLLQHTPSNETRPSKRRRHSDSPLRPIHVEERVNRERERVMISELVHEQPVEIAIAGPSSSPRRPGSGHGRRIVPSPVPLVEQVTVEGEKEKHFHVLGPNHSSIEVRDIVRERDAHKMFSPLGRRSPPGSQIGRAKAARKVEESDSACGVDLPANQIGRGKVARKFEEGDLAPMLDPREQHHSISGPPGSQMGRTKSVRKAEEVDSALVSDMKDYPHAQGLPERGRQHAAEDKKKTQPRRPVDVPFTTDKVKLEKESQPRPLPSKPPQEDAHEWLLEHYAEDPAPAISHPQPLLPLRSPSPRPIASPATLPSPIRPSHSPMVKNRTPTPTTMPEAAGVLEKELEEIIADPIGKQEEPDVVLDPDASLGVTESVAETLKEEGARREDITMEDVDDELLSLVDYIPLQSVRRAPGSKLGPSSTGLSPQSAEPPSLLVTDTDVCQSSHLLSSAVPAPSYTLLSPAQESLPVRPPSDRESMLPPTSTSILSARGKDRDESDGHPGSATTTPAAKKRKEGSAKPVLKPKATGSIPSKPRAKPGPKPKLKNVEAGGAMPASARANKISAPPFKKSGSTPAASRSRSASVMPGSGGLDGDSKAEKQEEEEESDANEDDKLYCVCKTRYDEDRFMIACDRCDEWYHTQCVDMPDLEVDLVDQFICPLCIDKNPQLSLRTTYKQRCLFGLKHPDPSSPEACHKPARGAFSKYCSDECGVNYMQTRIDAWAKKGGKKDMLWETVKNAEKREGVVICAEDPDARMEVDGECRKDGVKSKKGKAEREIERLSTLLDQVVKLREEIKRGMEVVVWRERLLELASERAENVGQCGWDQRLCFGDEEWADFGAGVLESYEEGKASEEVGEEGDDMQVDGEGDGEWWCPGKKMCNRHAGWQTVRHKDVCKEKERKEEALLKLTTREREIRKRIEDIVDPHGHNCNEPSSKAPLKSHNVKLSNGHAKGKMNGDALKKGKKRKVPTS